LIVVEALTSLSRRLLGGLINEYERAT
jgi:hypothetical protein